jgi:hypothetical protein
MQNSSKEEVNTSFSAPPSISAGSSTRSSSEDLPILIGESGEVASDELELGHRLWLRKENVGVIGVDAFDAPDEFRECPGLDRGKHGDAVILLSMLSLLWKVEILGSFRERMLSKMYPSMFQRDSLLRTRIRHLHGPIQRFDMHVRSQRDVWLLVAGGGATNATIPRLDVLARLTRLNTGYKATLIR